MTTLEDKAMTLERKLEGEDKRTVHQLNLMLKSLLCLVQTVHEIDELLEVIDYCGEEEGE